MTKPPTASSHETRGCQLLQQDIRLTRDPDTQRVIAQVDCARKVCTMNVEGCANCRHFVRIDTHEAGYVLLCGAESDEAAPDES